MAKNNVNQKMIVTPDILSASYRFERVLGEGSNGVTWLAKELKSGNLVAIKALKLSDDLKSIDLFMREADVLRSVKIKGVPAFYDCIVQNEESDTSYIIQEFINHPSLQTALDEGRIFSEAEVKNILWGISEILFKLQTQYAPPIIHRDIKPANILFAETEPEHFEVWLIDFGAVANPQKQSGGSTIAGTFGYMAPEQLQGECAVQSDFYAMGATAVHLLTGQSPYNIDTDLFKLQFEPVLDERAPETSAAMRKVLETLLAPNAADRPSSVSKLQKMLNNKTSGAEDEDEKELELQKPSLIEKFLRSWAKKRERWVPCTAEIRATFSTNFQGIRQYILESTYTYKQNLHYALLSIHNPAVLILDANYMPQDGPRSSINQIKVECLSSCSERYRVGFQVVWLSHEFYESIHPVENQISFKTSLEFISLALKDFRGRCISLEQHTSDDEALKKSCDLWQQLSAKIIKTETTIFELREYLKQPNVRPRTQFDPSEAQVDLIAVDRRINALKRSLNSYQNILDGLGDEDEASTSKKQSLSIGEIPGVIDLRRGSVQAELRGIKTSLNEAYQEKERILESIRQYEQTFNNVSKQVSYNKDFHLSKRTFEELLNQHNDRTDRLQAVFDCAAAIEYKLWHYWKFVPLISSDNIELRLNLVKHWYGDEHFLWSSTRSTALWSRSDTEETLTDVTQPSDDISEFVEQLLCCMEQCCEAYDRCLAVLNETKQNDIKLNI